MLYNEWFGVIKIPVGGNVEPVMKIPVGGNVEPVVKVLVWGKKKK